MSSRSYILQIILWYQSVKSIHYKSLLIFQNKKPTALRVKTWGGGEKRYVIPPMSKHGGCMDTSPIPPEFTPLVGVLTICYKNNNVTQKLKSIYKNAYYHV